MSEQALDACGDEVIRAEGLAKTYAEGSLHTRVFDGLDIAVRAGETVAILGASGAGKSTLLHLLGGLDVPSAGEVYVTGRKMSALSDAERGRLRKRALGFVYQFHHLLPEFTALENVMMPVLLAGQATSEAVRRAQALLESVGLGQIAACHAEAHRRRSLGVEVHDQDPLAQLGERSREAHDAGRLAHSTLAADDGNDHRIRPILADCLRPPLGGRRRAGNRLLSAPASGT